MSRPRIALPSYTNLFEDVSTHLRMTSRLITFKGRVSLLGAILLVTGCGEGIQVIREDHGKAVVLYRATEHHHMGSARNSAIKAMEQMCPAGYRILQEGQTQGRKRMVEGIGGPEIIREDWWGIRFRCRASDAQP